MYKIKFQEWLNQIKWEWIPVELIFLKSKTKTNLQQSYGLQYT